MQSQEIDPGRINSSRQGHDHAASSAGNSKDIIGTPSSLFTASTSRRWRPILIIVIAGIVALLPIIIWGIPTGADLYNHYRFAITLHESIQAGNIYPGWMAETNYGYGDTRFRFYPPALYYLLTTLYSLTGWYSASILAFCLLSVVAGLGVYFWCRGFCSTRIAMWAGIIYAFAPYHLNQVYRASMLAEYAACAILPFAFAFVERICRKGKATDIAGLSCAYALLIILHVPLTLIGSLALLVYAALQINKKSFWHVLPKLGLAVLLALAETAFFWITVLVELPWIRGNSAALKIHYDYRVNFLFSPSALTSISSRYANLLGLATIGLLLPALVLVKRKLFTRHGDSALRAVLLLALISLLMATEVSRPAWAIIPRLRDVQFPWRWLAVGSLFVSVLLAASIPVWIQKLRGGFRPRYLLTLLGPVLAVVFVANNVVWDAEYLRPKEFDSFISAGPDSETHKSWLPIWAKDLAQMKRMKHDVEADSRTVVINSWEPEHRSFQIASGPVEEARVRTYYYPHWIATSGGKPLPIRPADDGALLIAVPSGETIVELEFREPPRVAITRLVSGLAWIMMAVLVLVVPGRNAVLDYKLRRSSGKRLAPPDPPAPLAAQSALPRSPSPR